MLLLLGKRRRILCTSMMISCCLAPDVIISKDIVEGLAIISLNVW